MEEEGKREEEGKEASGSPSQDGSAEWEELEDDDDTGLTYYHNSETGEVSWTRPSAMGAVQTADDGDETGELIDGVWEVHDDEDTGTQCGCTVLGILADHL